MSGINSKDIKRKIWFSSPEAAGVFKQDITGQISDGYWENSNANWEYWYDLDPQVDTTGLRLGIEQNIPPFDTFNLHKIVPYVGDELCVTANLSRAGYDASYSRTFGDLMHSGKSWSPDNDKACLKMLGLPENTTKEDIQQFYKGIEYYTKKNIGQLLDEITYSMRNTVKHFPDINNSEAVKEFLDDSGCMRNPTDKQIVKILGYIETVQDETAKIAYLSRLGKEVDRTTELREPKKRDFEYLAHAFSESKLLQDPEYAQWLARPIHLKNVTSATKGVHEMLDFICHSLPNEAIVINPQSLSGTLAPKGDALVQVCSGYMGSLKVPTEAVDSNGKTKPNMVTFSSTCKDWKRPVVHSINRVLTKELSPKTQQDIDAVLTLSTKIAEQKYPMEELSKVRRDINWAKKDSPEYTAIDALDTYTKQKEHNKLMGR